MLTLETIGTVVKKFNSSKQKTQLNLNQSRLRTTHAPPTNLRAITLGGFGLGWRLRRYFEINFFLRRSENSQRKR